MGFKTLRCARILLGGIEVMHMIVKGQLQAGATAQTPTEHAGYTYRDKSDTPW